MTSSYLPFSPANRRYGVYRESPDQPGRKIFMRAALGVPLPSSATLVPWMGAIRDQGQEGSCTGQMGAAIRDLLYRKYFQFEITKIAGGSSAYSASSAFIYLSNLKADGNLGSDCGSTIHQTMVTLNQRGACPTELDPYLAGQVSVPPSVGQLLAAAKFRAGAYHFLPDLTAIRECIASGYPCGFGIQVYESFEHSWHTSGLMPMPDPTREQLLGLHAQPVIAYDDNIEFPGGLNGGLLIQNSWGSGWGVSAPGRNDRGCYWMPYSFVEAGYTSDCWMIHLGPAWK